MQPVALALMHRELGRQHDRIEMLASSAFVNSLTREVTFL